MDDGPVSYGFQAFQVPLNLAKDTNRGGRAYLISLGQGRGPKKDTEGITWANNPILPIPTAHGSPRLEVDRPEWAKTGQKRGQPLRSKFLGTSVVTS